jgi:hypothetical protein
MDHNSYWYRYLAARHDLLLKMGTVLVGAACIFAVTGRCWVRGKGIVRRVEDPKMFWQNVALYLLLGFIFLGLFLYTND